MLRGELFGRSNQWEQERGRDRIFLYSLTVAVHGVLWFVVMLLLFPVMMVLPIPSPRSMTLLRYISTTSGYTPFFTWIVNLSLPGGAYLRAAMMVEWPPLPS